MERIGALSGMRLMVILLIFMAGYIDAGAAQEIDESDTFRLELNPHDYVPLAVGNRWTYEHEYTSDTLGTIVTPYDGIGNHLHFEVFRRTNLDYINPLSELPRIPDANPRRS